MKTLNITIIIVFILSIQIFSQYGSTGVTDARSLGLGKTHTATSEGVFAIGINPANLIFSKEGSIDFSTALPLPSAGLRSGTDFLSYDDFKYYFSAVSYTHLTLPTSDLV